MQYLWMLFKLSLWLKEPIFLTFHIKFKCLFIFNQLQQLLKCACAKITKTNTESRTEMLKNQESLLLGTRHFLIYDKWPPSLSFDRVKTFYGSFNVFQLLHIHITNKNHQRFEHTFCRFQKMIHAWNMMPLVHSSCSGFGV